MVRFSTCIFLSINAIFWISHSLNTEITIGSKNGIRSEPLEKRSYGSVVDRCLEVSNAIKFNEEFLNQYEYDDTHCLKFRQIGNYVLEKNGMSSFNCYKKIQKPLCKLHYTEKENRIEDSIHNECEETKDFFISLMKRCTIKGNKDPLVHCASFSKFQNFIQDASIFCTSSYERREEKPDGHDTKSVYGEYFPRSSIKTYTFTKNQMGDCIDIVNNYNYCSIVERNLLKMEGNQNDEDSIMDACLMKRSFHYCTSKIDQVQNQRYTLDCTDIILPYLLGSKNENTGYTQLCYDIKNNYLSSLKEQKNVLLKEKRKLEEEIKNMRILFKSSKMVENMFNVLNKELERSSYDINTFFEKIEKLKNQRVLQHEEYKINVQKMSDRINKFKNIISKFEYPSFEKNSREENISSIKKTKIFIDNLITVQREITDIARELNEFIEKRSSSSYSTSADEPEIPSNHDELFKLKNKYFTSKQLIIGYAERNENAHMEYFKSQEKDFLQSIKNYNTLIEIFSQQIALVLERNFA